MTMPDVATPAGAAVCVATGGVAGPFCAAFGFDPTLMLGGLVGGLIGCVIVQTLIPDKDEIPFRRILTLAVGSVLLAGLATLIASPMIIRALSLTDVPPGAVRLVIGAAIGGCAQPLAVMGQRKFLDWFGGLGKRDA